MQCPEKWGRDHNTHGFSSWMAGGGFKGGHVQAETDEWGPHAIKDIVHHYDWHATLLHLFGLDHTKLIFKRIGTDATLIDGQPAPIVSEMLARAMPPCPRRMRGPTAHIIPAWGKAPGNAPQRTPRAGSPLDLISPAKTSGTLWEFLSGIFSRPLSRPLSPE